MAGLKADLEAQRAAMAKLGFLVGKWEGELRAYRGSEHPAVFQMTEDASWRLDGLILLMEGVGREPSSGKPALQAFGFICYDDAAQAYRMRAFNDGRFLESEAHLADDGKGLSWGFAVEHVRTRAVLRINERGEWTEEHDITIGEQPARKLMELVVRRKE